MRILFAHNYYKTSAPSGENTVYELERDLLAARGHQIREYTLSNDGLDRSWYSGLSAAATLLWNARVVRDIAAISEDWRPDVLHVHNTFPRLSMSIFYSVRRLMTATVWTLHNYRPYCASGRFVRDGRTCTVCKDTRSAMPAIVHGCYRGQRTATVPVASSIALHRRLGTIANEIDAIIVPSEFARELLVSREVPAERTFVKAHFYPGSWCPVPWQDRRGDAIYIGRVEKVKGVYTLVEAWANLGERAPYLDIVGDGPDLHHLQALIRAKNLEGRICCRGALPHSDVRNVLANAKLLVAPSEFFESFGMVVMEAMALGVPVVASRIGSYPEVIGHEAGALFDSGDPVSLANAVLKLWSDPSLLEQHSENAQRAALSAYSSGRAYDVALEVYDRAIRHRRAKMGSVVGKRRGTERDDLTDAPLRSRRVL
ncbi:MAG TPA: glycosyltransferase family 4 protein [Bryobacteraceae bacterium]|nr:glycosyltransferase family 4 protein [Bryobacteraceae bacterium]